MIRPTGALALLLAIPGLVAAQQPTAADTTGPASVTGVEVRGVPLRQSQDATSYEARRRSLESRPFQPLSVPEPPLEERTVFFEVPQARTDRTVVVGIAPERTLALSPSVFQGAGWLIPSGARPERLGTVAGLIDWSAEESTIYGQLFGHIRIHVSAEGSPQVGDEFLLYAIDRNIDGVGQVAIPSGRVRTVSVEGKEVLAEVIQLFGRMRAGDLVTAAKVFPLEPGMHPVAFEGEMEGRILAFQREQATHRSDDYAFIDLGRRQGLALGDELAGVTESAEDWQDRVLARFQVVGLGEETATVRVLSTVSPRNIRAGMRVVVDRKMP